MRFSVGGRTWQPHEREVFETYAGNDNWLAALKEAFPNRTEMALKVQMSKLRVDHGMADGYDMGDWVSDARQASQRLAEATLRVGMWT